MNSYAYWASFDAPSHLFDSFTNTKILTYIHRLDIRKIYFCSTQLILFIYRHWAHHQHTRVCVYLFILPFFVLPGICWYFGRQTIWRHVKMWYVDDPRIELRRYTSNHLAKCFSLIIYDIINRNTLFGLFAPVSLSLSPSSHMKF